MVKIRVTRIEPPGPEDGQSLPVVHFEGFSKSLDSSLDENANSGLTGEVSAKGTGSFRGLASCAATLAPVPVPRPSSPPGLDLLPDARGSREVREKLADCVLSNRERPTHQGGRGALDKPLHLQRPGEVAQREHPGRRAEVGQGGRELVRQVREGAGQWYL